MYSLLSHGDIKVAVSGAQWSVMDQETVTSGPVRDCRGQCFIHSDLLLGNRAQPDVTWKRRLVKQSFHVYQC